MYVFVRMTTSTNFCPFRGVAIPLSYWEKHPRHRRYWVIDGKYYFSKGSQAQKVSLHKKATLARLTPASKTFLLLERDLSQGKFPSTTMAKLQNQRRSWEKRAITKKTKSSLLPLDIFLSFFCGLQSASICCYTYDKPRFGNMEIVPFSVHVISL